MKENVSKGKRIADFASSELSAFYEGNFTDFSSREEDDTPVGYSSVYDKVLGGNLLQLQGRLLKLVNEISKPEKYYFFYYSASWCSPCNEFTPLLIKFYRDYKNSSFEIVGISGDSDENIMEAYAEKMAIPWPILRRSKVIDFKKEFRYSILGIPGIVACKLDGTELDHYIGNLRGLSKLIRE